LNARPNKRLVLQAIGQSFTLEKVPDFEGRVYTSGAVSKHLALVTKDGQTSVIGLPRFEAGLVQASDGAILSPMPGRIIAVEVTQGQTVVKGQKLLTLEAMKMEHSLTAPFDGVVAELNAVAGAQVQVEALLVRISAVED
jgi:3-methylcrotonyl-CoA carboxylase alpha subunit